MRKRDELTDPASCLSKARDDEWIFVILERDDSAEDAILGWIASRIVKRKNRPDDPQLVEAYELSQRMAAAAKSRAVREDLAIRSDWKVQPFGAEEREIEGRG